MPRRLIKDGYRGWYGWEAKFNSIIRMSLESMSNTNAKNKRERFHFSRCQLQIREDERKYAERSRKDLYDLKQELFTIRAYGKVYKKYSFQHSDNAQEADDLQLRVETKDGFGNANESTGRMRNGRQGHADKPKETVDLKHGQGIVHRHGKNASGNSETYSAGNSCLKNSGNSENKRTLPKGTRVSFADDKTPNSSTEVDTEHITLPNIIDASVPVVNIVEGKDENENLNGEEELIYEPKIHSLPSIVSIYQKKENEATERELKYKSKKRQKLLSKWNQAISEVREQVKLEKVVSEASETSSDHVEITPEVEQNVSRSRKLARAMEGHGEKTKQEIRAKIFPAECRNTFTLRRFIDKQADDLLKVWTPETVRRHKVKKILERVKFPELVNRNRSTSAIYRDYHVYERVRGLNAKKTEQAEPESVNEISLRSLKAKYGKISPTVQPSDGSPLSQEHQHIHSPRRGLRGRREATIAVPTTKTVKSPETLDNVKIMQTIS